MAEERAPEEEAPKEGPGEEEQTVAQSIDEFHTILKDAFGNPNAFAMVAVLIPVQGGKTACNVRFLSQGQLDGRLAYVGVMQAAHQVAEQEFEWPPGKGPMDMLKQAFLKQQRSVGRG